MFFQMKVVLRFLAVLLEHSALKDPPIVPSVMTVIIKLITNRIDALNALLVSFTETTLINLNGN